MRQNTVYFRDNDQDESGQSHLRNNDVNLTGNPFLDVPNSSNAVEYKKGYVMRKCCYEANAKRSEYTLKINRLIELTKLIKELKKISFHYLL